MTADEKRKFWMNHRKQWEESSMTQIEYCKRAGISIHIFRKFSEKLSKEMKGLDKKPSGFFLVPENKVPKTSNLINKINELKNQTNLKLQLPHQMYLEVPDNFNPETLYTLLNVVKVL